MYEGRRRRDCGSWWTPNLDSILRKIFQSHQKEQSRLRERESQTHLGSKLTIFPQRDLHQIHQNLLHPLPFLSKLWYTNLEPIWRNFSITPEGAGQTERERESQTHWVYQAHNLPGRALQNQTHWNILHSPLAFLSVANFGICSRNKEEEEGDSHQSTFGCRWFLLPGKLVDKDLESTYRVILQHITSTSCAERFYGGRHDGYEYFFCFFLLKI